MEKYHRQYETAFEKGKRFQIFSENVDQIYDSNSKNHSFTLGITENADLTFAEWRASHLSGFKPVLAAERKNGPVFHAPKGFTPPDSIDWVKKGGVTEVKNQGDCGAWWLFSAVGALEGAMAATGRKMVDLSMQHILECDNGTFPYSGIGCDGGDSSSEAFSWVGDNGLTSLADEPYLCEDANSSQCKNMRCGGCTKRTGESCKVANSESNCSDGTVCDKTYSCICPENYCFYDGKCGNAPPAPQMVLNVGDVVSFTVVDKTDNALEAAVSRQPVSVAIEADSSVFQHYTSGVLTDDTCGDNPDHGVLLVGYGVDNGQKYWKIKTSWGTTFGEDGYIRIERGGNHSHGECGVRLFATFPVLKESNVVV